MKWKYSPLARNNSKVRIEKLVILVSKSIKNIKNASILNIIDQKPPIILRASLVKYNNEHQ
jgi:hypothetical protein